MTGTRIVRDGYNAPTPVTVVGPEQIQASSPANLQDFVNQLPSVIGSSQTNSGAASISGGGAGISALNLRSLGVARTLVLLDGHRSSSALASGEVDINTFPQQLVTRIDVVTGGASADYGSDAVGGVVNFILDKEFTGLKSDLEYGETTYGEQPNYKAQLTYGTIFDGGRGHVILSGEVFTSGRIVGIPRDWNQVNYHTSQTASGGTNGEPYLFVSKDTAPSQTAPGGLIVSGPLKGTYFGNVSASGTLAVNQLAYGVVNGAWMVGGDTAVTCANYCSGTDLTAGELRQNIYARASYSITPDIEVYAEASFAKSVVKQTYLAGWANVGGITIRSDNAFLPASVKAALTAANQTQFTMGSTNLGLGPSASQDSRQVTRFLAGSQGTVHLLGDWKYDAYGQYSASDLNIQTIGNWQTQRMAYAQDAVVVTAANVGTSGLPIGSIQCRALLSAATAAAAAGCQPLSRIGIDGGLQDTLMGAGAYQKGIDYVEYIQPWKDEFIRQTDFGFNVSGNPFENWAGPVSLAFGGEWRLLSINANIRPDFYSNWLVGNYLVNFGHYSVAEGYAEAVVPIMPGMDANGAIRYTAYSTSGGVNTWKLGLNYAPIDDVRFRFTYSHDIRAPNLSELFSAGLARSNTVTINNQPYAFVQNQTGNPDVTPEAANSLGAGVVLSPTFIPDLVMSVDYYNIHVKHQIGVISAQNVVDLCYILNVTSYCPNIHSTGTLGTNFAISTIDLKPINFASTIAEGIDFDVTYTVPLEDMNWFGQIPGALRIHALATHYMTNYSDDGFNPTVDSAGTNVSGGVPDLLYRIEATYVADPWTFNFVGRGVSDGKISNEYIVCATNCPLSTPDHRTINYNHIDGAFYVDLNLAYAFDAYGFENSLFFTVKNVFNASPALVPTGGIQSTSASVAAYPNTNPQLYDIYGRIFRFGIRSRL